MTKRLYATASLIAIVLVMIASMSCKTVKNADKAASTNNKLDTLPCLPVVLDTNGKFTESDPFQLINAELNGKCLAIEVEYSGGCGGDTWTLAWTGALMKSMPPKANIYLHLKDEDACREVVRKKVYFDISSIYNKGEVVLMLKDFRGMLTYSPK
jgi:hypothetical protein